MNSGWRRSRRSWVSTVVLVLGMIFWGLTFAAIAGAFLPPKRSFWSGRSLRKIPVSDRGKRQERRGPEGYLAPKVSKEVMRPELEAV